MLCLYSGPLKQLCVALHSLLKGTLRGLFLRLVQQWSKARPRNIVEQTLAELLFRNISLLIKVCKDSQFEVKVVVFIAVLRFVGIELGQVSQLLAVGLCLSGLWICGLQIYSLRIYGLQICDLNNGGNLVRILVYRGVVVHNLGTGCALARKINSKGTWVYRINLVKQVRYKASDLIKLRRSKEFIYNVDLVQDFLFGLFHLVFLIQCIV